MSKASATPDKADKKSPKIILNKISSIVIGAIFILVMIAMFSLITQSAGGKKPSIFGYRLYFVLTDSMEPTLKVNDVLISQTITSAHQAEITVKEGDIITFVAEYGVQKGMTITHRVVRGMHFDQTYNRYVVQTKGDNVNASVDPAVPIENIQAVMISNSKFFTKLYKMCTSFMGILLILIIPFIFVMASLIYRLVVLIKTPPQSDEDKEKHRINQIKLQAIAEYKEKLSKEIAEKAVKDYIEQHKKGDCNE